MLKYLSLLLAFLLFAGCGGSDGNSQNISHSISTKSYQKVRSKHDAGKDPLYKYQWYLDGKYGINIGSVWKKYLGDGVVVAILDSGIEADHDDLRQSVDYSKSYRYSDNSNNPSFLPNQVNNKNFDLAHGTAVAGVISAAHNGVGMMGISPNVDLASLNVFSHASDSAFRDAIERDGIDISSNSWGKNIANSLEDDRVVLDAIKRKMSRDPVIYIFSSGNEYSNTNFSSVLSSRYTLVVGASNKSGKIAPYSNRGSSLLCVAPGGESKGILTTDLNGEELGYDTKFVHFDVEQNQNYNYTQEFKGTSASAAIVSGVVALMLEANPNLNYRDVRYIIEHTSRVIDRSNETWSKNAAGIYFSNVYGFGLIDASKAVAMSEGFSTIGDEISITKVLKSPKNFSDLAGVDVKFDIDDDFIVEYAELTLDAQGVNSGDLKIDLTSSSNTTSNLAKGKTKLKGNYSNWHFGTLAFVDEKSQGVWSLHIEDLGLGGKGVLRSAKLTLYGHYN